MNKESKDYFVENLLASSESVSALNFAFQSQLESAQVNFDLSDIDAAYKKVVEEYGEMVEAYNKKDADFGHFKEEL
jgi:phosphoribosyl-ATP pyrophosphohydrolase